MAKPHQHLRPKIVSLGNLMQAANPAMRGRRSLAPVAEFFAEWELGWVNLSEELENGSYRPAAYRYFKIYEPKERMVAAASSRGPAFPERIEESGRISQSSGGDW